MANQPTSKNCRTGLKCSESGEVFRHNPLQQTHLSATLASFFSVREQMPQTAGRIDWKSQIE